MSQDLYTYGANNRIIFKVTLNGVGVPDLTFQDEDINVSKDNGDWLAIGSVVTEMVSASDGKGWYIWTPASAGLTQCEDLVINVADASGSAFDENGIVLGTGNDPSARF